MVGHVADGAAILASLTPGPRTGTMLEMGCEQVDDGLLKHVDLSMWTSRRSLRSSPVVVDAGLETCLK